MRPYDYTSRMFRLAFIDRIKARNDIPIHLTECITGEMEEIKQSFLPVEA